MTLDDPDPTYPKLPQFDPAEYLHLYEGDGATEAEKVAHLKALWLIMESFVDLAFHEQGPPEHSKERTPK